ncbi:2-oxoacid:acceptor oxidoreductase family protein, partial [bacterium]|nr:2-oxoacid:acceptor oxidoreductase family protein [bacterium]
LGIKVIGKDEESTITNWSPEEVLRFLSQQVDIGYQPQTRKTGIPPLPRPPSICPGCAYKAFTLTAQRLKKRNKLYASFGDIGCSTLLYFFDAIDTVSCMGASDSMRQGFVLSRPDMADRVISVIGDSTECHSGLDSTRNAVFRNVPGVKIILDNYTTAMTGGQPAPSSPHNLEGQPHRFSLKEAIKAEGGRSVVVDAFDLKAVEKELKEALKLAGQKLFSTLILEGECIHEAEAEQLIRQIEFDYEKCKEKCNLCNICPGIEFDADNTPHFTTLCTNCCGNTPICLQRCPSGAIVTKDDEKIAGKTSPELPTVEAVETVHVNKKALPDALRVSIRGIGGQGNLFFGRVLSEVALRTPYADTHIVKGETHGMAQLGGPVISTFSCGDVYSPVLTPNSADVLVVMEISEVLRPGFIEQLKPGGTVIINDFTALPVNVKKEDYPLLEDIEELLSGYNIVKIDANNLALQIGDKLGRTSNVIVIGLLSTIKPFSNIPEAIWQAAIQAVSPNDFAKSINMLAFATGRNFASRDQERI